MQLEDENNTDPSKLREASELAEYVLAMSLQLAELARKAGMKDLARSLEETHRAAVAALEAVQVGKAAPDDAA